MPQYEYRVIPAPAGAQKPRGITSTATRVANALQTLMNDMGMRGWEYQRAETLPGGDTGSEPETKQTLLIFRRPVAAKSPLVLQAAERLSTPPPRKPGLAKTTPADDKVPDVVAKAIPGRPRPAWTRPAGPQDDASGSEGAARMLQDNGVEDFSEVSGLTNSLLQLAAARKSSNSAG